MSEHPAAGRPGPFEIENLAAINAGIVEGRYGQVTKTAAVIPVSVESWERNQVAFRVDAELVDRWQHPWKYPDRPRWPEFVPAPRLAAFLATVQNRRQRLRDAYAVLRGRERLYDPDLDDQW